MAKHYPQKRTITQSNNTRTVICKCIGTLKKDTYITVNKTENNYAAPTYTVSREILGNLEMPHNPSKKKHKSETPITVALYHLKLQQVLYIVSVYKEQKALFIYGENIHIIHSILQHCFGFFLFLVLIRPAPISYY
jgi:hypothetical protein